MCVKRVSEEGSEFEEKWVFFSLGEIKYSVFLPKIANINGSANERLDSWLTEMRERGVKGPRRYTRTVNSAESEDSCSFFKFL